MKMEQFGGSDQTSITTNNTKDLYPELNDFKYFKDQMRPKPTDLKLTVIEFVDNTNKESSAVSQNLNSVVTPKNLSKDSDNLQLPASRPLNPSIRPLESPQSTPFSRPLPPFSPGSPTPERNRFQQRQPEGLIPAEKPTIPVKSSKEPERSAPTGDQSPLKGVLEQNSSNRSTTEGADSAVIAPYTTDKSPNESDAAYSEPVTEKGFLGHFDEQSKKIFSTLGQAFSDYIELCKTEQNRLRDDLARRFDPEMADQLIKMGCQKISIDGNSVHMEFDRDQNIPINQNGLRSVIIERNVKLDFAKNGDDIDIKNIKGVRLDFRISKLSVPDVTLTPNGTAKTSFASLPFPPEIFNRVKTAVEKSNK